jgi:hypothetical protein
MRFTDAFKSAAHKSVKESKIPGSNSLRHHDAANLAPSSQSRYATPTTHTESLTKTSSDSCTIRLNSHDCNPGGAAPDSLRCNLKGSIMRTVVVVWKRAMHALRHESSRDSPRGVLTCSRFAMTTLRSRMTPWRTLESGASREASLAGGVDCDSGSAWSLV